MRVAFFAAVDRPVPHVRDLPWTRLVEVLTRIRPISGTREERGAICPLWAPVRLRPGGRRRAADVIEVCAMVLDYDDGTSMHEALDRWEGYERVAHTTWGNQADAPRSRLVMPLSEPISAAIWPRVYLWVLRMDGMDADAKCQDPSRQFYLPAIGAGGPQATRHRTGRLLDLAAVARRAERELAEAQARRAAEHRARLGRLRHSVSTAAQRDRETRRALTIDWQAREALGATLGGRVVHRACGAVIRGVTCPACRRPSVWWLIEPQKWTGAKCEHIQSCGWSGRLWDLALDSG